MQTAAHHPAALADDALLAQCTVRRTKRSGPGGQHRNKVETAVILTHRGTGLTAEANERRSQAANRSVAIFRLRLQLALQVRRPVAMTDAPSELWLHRCRNRRVSVSPRHGDFPVLLAEALDTIAAAGLDMKAAAQRLQCSSSQLVGLLQRDPRALSLVNSLRTGAGLSRLR